MTTCAKTAHKKNKNKTHKNTQKQKTWETYKSSSVTAHHVIIVFASNIISVCCLLS